MIIKINPKILSRYFDPQIRTNCREGCKRYGEKVCCPPNIGHIRRYEELLPTYDYGELIIEKFDIDNPKNWKELGKSSSLVIAKQLYSLKERYENSIIFGAGSCKYCSEVCYYPCKHPDKMLIPLEATGIDVVRLVQDTCKIKLIFPVKDIFYRIGAILYDET